MCVSDNTAFETLSLETLLDPPNYKKKKKYQDDVGKYLIQFMQNSVTVLLDAAWGYSWNPLISSTKINQNVS